MIPSTSLSFGEPNAGTQEASDIPAAMEKKENTCVFARLPVVATLSLLLHNSGSTTWGMVLTIVGWGFQKQDSHPKDML